MRTILRSGLLSLTPLLILGLTPHTARAATINVPAGQPTIQAAINAALNGDTVLVAPGTYYENIDFMGKAITVTSSGGPAVTTIDGGRVGTVVMFRTNEGRNSVLSGFTITKGASYNNYQNLGISDSNGGGINISNASPTVSRDIITGNAACSRGDGIAAEFSSALIQGNTISNNGCASGDGGGIYVGGAGSVQIIGNTISGNFFDLGGNGAGITLDDAGTPTIENNTISGNRALGAASQGGGIWIVNDSDALIVQNLIVNNAAGSGGISPGGLGGGIYFYVPSGGRGPFLINNTIANNPAAQASGVYADGYDSQSQLINNLIIGIYGYPALVCNGPPPVVQFNDALSSGGNGFDGICAGMAGANGNISAAPLFLNAASNFHVQPGSPVIDAGNSGAPNLPATDLDGNPRIGDGNNDGTAIVDLGAYEFTPTTDTLSPASLTFGNQTAGTTSAAQTVTLTNTGGQKLLFSISIDSGFAETDDCGAAVAPGAACSINVTFSPELVERSTPTSQFAVTPREALRPSRSPVPA